MNLVNILSSLKSNQVLWSPLCGKCTVKVTEGPYPIKIIDSDGAEMTSITKNGTFTNGDGSEELMIYPSKEQRDWSQFSKNSKFSPSQLKPYDKVLVKSFFGSKWVLDYFSHIKKNKINCIVSGEVSCCIPYNKDTEHLLGTTNQVSKYYKYWND